MKVTPQVPALTGMTPMGFTPVNGDVSSLLELADELDKGENMDIGWTKYQGNLLRRVAHRLSHNGR